MGFLGDPMYSWRLDVYAVVESGGKQYRVEVGQSIQVDKLQYEVGDKLELDKVLLVADESGVRIGQPHLEGASVHATVMSRYTVLFPPRNE